MGDKKPIRYTVYSALALFMSILGLADLIAMPLLFESGMIWPKMSDGVFAICYITGGVICVVLAVFFFRRALMVAGWTPFENDKLKIQEKKGKPSSFEVMDTLHGCVVFTGFFI